jgi:hypothetical protein
MQELAHASEAEIICGSRSLEWEQAHFGLRVHDLRPSTKHSLLSVFWNIDSLSLLRDDTVRLRESSPAPDSHLSLELIHIFTHGKSCSDPRDRLYSIRSLSPTLRTALSPDYTCSLAQVCLIAVQAIIQESGRLDILCRFNYPSVLEKNFIGTIEIEEAQWDFVWEEIGSDEPNDAQISATVQRFRSNVDSESESGRPRVLHNEASLPLLPRKGEFVPSWLPDLTLETDYIMGCTTVLPFRRKESGSIIIDRKSQKISDISQDLYLSHTLPILTPTTAVYDTIIFVSPRINVLEQGFCYLSLLRDRFKDAVYPTGQSIDEVICNLAFLDSELIDVPLHVGKLDPDQIRESQRLLLLILDTISDYISQGLGEGDGQVDFFRETRGNPLHQALMNHIAASTSSAVLCATAKGYLGTIYGRPKEGDKICIVEGAFAPVVLRSVGMFEEFVAEYGINIDYSMNEDRETYAKSGTAFIVGLMNGKAVQLTQESEIQQRKIILI